MKSPRAVFVAWLMLVAIVTFVVGACWLVALGVQHYGDWVGVAVVAFIASLFGAYCAAEEPR